MFTGNGRVCHERLLPLRTIVSRWCTHLLEGRDGLPALWHSRDEGGRGGRVVVLPRLLDELANGDQARHLSARSRFPSVVPSPARRPLPHPTTLLPSAQLQARLSPRRIASRHRDSPSLVVVAAVVVVVVVVAGDRAALFSHSADTVHFTCLSP